jgi:dolichyl-phosphate-mannose--protein O-mannosyl transferase
MWAGALAFLHQYPQYKDDAQGLVNTDEFHVFMEGETVPVTPLELLREGRLAMAAVQVAVLAVCYIYARRLFGLLPAFVGMLLVAFDPFYLGLTRLLHLDGLMTSFVLLALLAYTVFLSERRIADLLVSGIAAGLGWLTKSPALILAPVLGMLTF